MTLKMKIYDGMMTIEEGVGLILGGNYREGGLEEVLLLNTRFTMIIKTKILQHLYKLRVTSQFHVKKGQGSYWESTRAEFFSQV